MEPCDGRSRQPIYDPGVSLAPLPSSGRVVERARRVRFGDVSPGARLRLDATARYLQDIANDDARGGLPDEEVNAWVVRRTVIEIAQFPVCDEELELRTWCSGIGGRWAERRTRVTGDLGGHVDTASVWVHVDAVTGRPKVLSSDFHACYDEAAGGRKISARLEHRDPPAVDGASMAWPIRFVDCDVLGHVNNAAYWNPVEEMLATRRDVRAPMRAELEHRLPVELDALGLGGAVELRSWARPSGFEQWWCVGSVVHASAVVTAGVGR